MAQPKNTKVKLPRFKQALKQHQATMAVATYYRWGNGQAPPAIQFLVKYPDVLAALLEDAQALATKAQGGQESQA